MENRSLRKVNHRESEAVRRAHAAALYADTAETTLVGVREQLKQTEVTDRNCSTLNTVADNLGKLASEAMLRAEHDLRRNQYDEVIMGVLQREAVGNIMHTAPQAA